MTDWDKLRSQVADPVLLTFIDALAQRYESLDAALAKVGISLDGWIVRDIDVSWSHDPLVMQTFGSTSSTSVHTGHSSMRLSVQMDR